jgi:HAE1 family hydrophobic/amphiphilic exporter-1
MLTSTMLVLLVLSAAYGIMGLWDYGIMEDIGFIELTNEEQGTEAEEVAHLV